MYNQDNARDDAACPDEQSTNRSKPTNQAQINNKTATVLQTYLNG